MVLKSPVIRSDGSTSSSSPTSTRIVAVAAFSVVASVGCFICVYYLKRRVKIRQLKDERHNIAIMATPLHYEQVEEMKINDDLKQSQQKQQDSNIVVMPIGTISTVFRLCVGTPRQGLLVPNSRGIIQIDSSKLALDCIVGLQEFSHIWVVFLFHLNTNVNTVIASTNRKNRMFPSKVSPPALGGKKVGIFTTRTPHRFNPIGFSLCKLDHVDVKNNRLYVSGIDLVDGTPILDIKPFVPHYDSVENNVNRLPDWVETGLDQRRSVDFTLESEKQLRHMVQTHQLQFYNNSSNVRVASNEKDAQYRTIMEQENAEYQNVKLCIQQTLEVDVRSVRQTRKARQGAFQAERALRDVVVTIDDDADQLVTMLEEELSEEDRQQQQPLCTQQLDNMLIHFSVSSPMVKQQFDYENSNVLEDSRNSHAAAAGSGCNDIVKVVRIELLKVQEQLVDGCYENDDKSALAASTKADKSSDGRVKCTRAKAKRIVTHNSASDTSSTTNDRHSPSIKD